MMLKSWSSIEEVPYCQGHPWNFKVTRGKYCWFWAELSISGLSLQFEFTDGFEMIYKAWSSIERCPIVWQGHPSNFKVTQDKIANFDQKWAFLDCNCSLNSPMGLKWCTKLDVVQKSCPIVFRGHPSNLKVTYTEKSMIWIQFSAKLLGWSQLSNPSDLPCLWTMTSNSLIENEEHDIPSHSEDHFWIACLSYFLDPNMCGLQYICMVLWSQILLVNWQN